jgi:ArsR family transcriptional regulator
MPAAALELIAARFRMLAEPMRLRLLNELRDGEKTVTALVVATGAGQANVSKHLSLLADAGMVGRRKEGLNIFYFIVDESLFELCDLVCGRLQKELAEKARQFSG